MKKLLAANWMLGLAMLTAGCNIGLAQNEPPPAASAGETASTAPAAPAIPTPATDPALTKATVTTPRLSPWTTEMVKLARAGIEDRVMLSFIENAGTFNLGADQIVHLSDVGVPSDVIAAMLQHDYDVASGARPLTTVTMPPMDPVLEKLLVGLRDQPGKVSVPPPASPAPTAPGSGDSVEVAGGIDSIVVTVVDANTAPVKLTAQGIWKANLGRAPAPNPPKPPGLYRVPETRSVELVPPIIVLNGASPTPNLVVIEMFPSSR